MSDPIQEFKAAMLAAGLVPPDDVIADGKLHRFSSDGNARKKNGWYIMFADGLAAGRFGC
jgi:putative DNA primase/helicase